MCPRDKWMPGRFLLSCHGAAGIMPVVLAGGGGAVCSKAEPHVLEPSQPFIPITLTTMAAILPSHSQGETESC